MNFKVSIEESSKTFLKVLLKKNKLGIYDIPCQKGYKTKNKIYFKTIIILTNGEDCTTGRKCQYKQFCNKKEKY